MAKAVVRKVKLAGELAQKLNKTKQNHKDKLQDVQIWYRERLYRNAVIPRIEWL